LFILIGASSGYAIALLIDLKLHEWSLIPFVILLSATLLEFVFADLLAEHSYPIATERKLALMEQRLGANVIAAITENLKDMIDSFQACDTTKISGTVHVIVELTQTPELKTRNGLLQLTDYVGLSKGGKGRIVTLDKGIIGRCARTHQLEHVSFADVGEYKARMVSEFGFLKEEAESHETRARSYIAQPILVRSEVVGVLYFFSLEPQVFPIAAREANLPGRAKDLANLLKVISLV
jgi:hypothetical protein